jgi:hypothetical protein
MCVLCSQLWVEDHWSDSAGAAANARHDIVALEAHATRRGLRLRDRATRARLFNLVLADYGLSLQDWEGSSYVLRDAKGRSAIVPNLAGVWAEAERLIGVSLDPLDPKLLERLRLRSAPRESRS